MKGKIQSATKQNKDLQKEIQRLLQEATESKELRKTVNQHNNGLKEENNSIKLEITRLQKKNSTLERLNKAKEDIIIRRKQEVKK